MREKKPDKLSILVQGDAVKSTWLRYRPKQQQSHGGSYAFSLSEYFVKLVQERFRFGKRKAL